MTALVSRRLVLAAIASEEAGAAKVKIKWRVSPTTVAWLAAQVDAKIRWESNSGVAFFNPTTVQSWFPRITRHTWPRLWRWLAANGVARDKDGYWTVERHTSLEMEQEVARFVPVPAAALTLEKPIYFRVLTLLHRLADDERFDPKNPGVTHLDKRKTLLPWAGELSTKHNPFFHRFLAELAGIDPKTLRRVMRVLETRKYYVRKHNPWKQAQRLTPMDALATENAPVRISAKGLKKGSRSESKSATHIELDGTKTEGDLTSAPVGGSTSEAATPSLAISSTSTREAGLLGFISQNADFASFEESGEVANLAATGATP